MISVQTHYLSRRGTFALPKERMKTGSFLPKVPERDERGRRYMLLDLREVERRLKARAGREE